MPDGFTWRVSAGPIGEGLQHLQVLTYGAGSSLQRQLFDVEDDRPRVGHMGGCYRSAVRSTRSAFQAGRDIHGAAEPFVTWRVSEAE
jgi:hypothetical protein